MTGESYECAVCHGTFVKTCSDEEAEAGRRATWAEPQGGDGETEVVCDDCYVLVMAWAQLDAPELLRQERAP